MKKASLTTAVLAGSLVAASAAFASHGYEYPVSACDKDGASTAHMLITSVGVYERNEAIAQGVQETFTALMKDHTAEEHRSVDPAFVNDLVAKFGATTQRLAGETQQAYLYLDFHHPTNGAPVTPGCSP